MKTWLKCVRIVMKDFKLKAKMLETEKASMKELTPGADPDFHLRGAIFF